MLFDRIGGAERADVADLSARSVATHGENPNGLHPLRKSSGDGIAIGGAVGRENRWNHHCGLTCFGIKALSCFPHRNSLVLGLVLAFLAQIFGSIVVGM